MAVALCILGFVVADVARAQPNVVIVVTDDQPVGTLGPRKTPAIWQLIRRPGVYYPNAMVPTSLCCPSRASLLTGLYAHSTGVYRNSPPAGGWPTFYENGMEQRTLAVKLHDAGYRTGLVGKYLNGGPPMPGHVPTGWDTFLELPSGYYNYLFGGVSYGNTPADYSTDVLAGAAVRFIQETPADQPLFLYFAPYAPHSGSIPAPRHDGVWRGRLPSYRPPSVTEDVGDKPPWIRRLHRVPQWRIDRRRERIQETMMGVDDAVRNLHDALATTGRINNTLFVFLSDNGLMLGEHRLTSKATPYRRATSVPMVLRWDGHVKPGGTDTRLALNVDISGTVAAAAGMGMATEGRNLLSRHSRRGFPLEMGGLSNRNPPGRPAYCGYRTRKWLYVRYAGGFEELYHYPADPHELHNQAGKHRRVQAWMRRQAMRTCAPVPPGFAWHR